jgi:hypothetical protein
MSYDIDSNASAERISDQKYGAWTVSFLIDAQSEGPVGLYWRRSLFHPAVRLSRPLHFSEPPFLSRFHKLLGSDPRPINYAHLIGHLNCLLLRKPGSSEQPSTSVVIGGLRRHAHDR